MISAKEAREKSFENAIGKNRDLYDKIKNKLEEVINANIAEGATHLSTNNLFGEATFGDDADFKAYGYVLRNLATELDHLGYRVAKLFITPPLPEEYARVHKTGKLKIEIVAEISWR